MKKLISVFSVLLFLSSLQFGFGQAERYLFPVFDSVQVTSDVIYGGNYQEMPPDSLELIDLNMDVYEPFNDTLSARPLILMIHAGSLMPKGDNGLPYGDKTDSVNVSLCHEFARRGFVCASLNFRLGWNPFVAYAHIRTKTFVRAIYRAMLDVRTATRFFNKDASNDQIFRTDSTRVVVAGNNTGALTALLMAYLNRTEELYIPEFFTPDILPIINVDTLGQLDGSGGHPAYNVFNHPGYGSDVHMVLNMGGGIPDTSWLDPSDQAALVSVHETQNPIIPYEDQIIFIPYILDPVLSLYGSFDLHQHITENDLPFTDFGHHNFSDIYTEAAQDNSNQVDQAYYRGLYPTNSTTYSFEPWSWYDPNDPFIDNNILNASGYGSIYNPFNNPTESMHYLDTIIQYFVPRSCFALDLPCKELLNTWYEIEKQATSIQIFPNPVQSQLWLESQDKNEFLEAFQVFDLTGKKVLAKRLNKVRISSINVSSLPPGIYSLWIRSNISNSTFRFVKVD